MSQETNDLASLAVALSTLETRETKQRMKAEAELALRSKCAPRKPQAPPVGLFEKKQEELF